MLNEQIEALRRKGIYPEFKTQPVTIRCTLHSPKWQQQPWGEGHTLEEALQAAIKEMKR